MNFSSVFRWSLAVLALLAIAWKITVPVDDQSHVKEDLVGFFQRNHFNVVITDEMINYTPIIRAAAAACQVQAASLTPDGSNRNLILSLASGTDRSFVVFRGAVYSDQPVFWTVLDHFWSRFLRELGLVSHISPVINVAETSSCNAERLPWGELNDPT